jgi:hypothetical protein
MDITKRKAAACTSAADKVMNDFIYDLMLEYKVNDPKTAEYCANRLNIAIWRALDEVEWAVSERAMV